MTQHELRAVSLPLSRAAIGTAGIVNAGIAAAAVLLWWLCRDHASLLPSWAPWDFSWINILAVWLPLWWFARGTNLVAADGRVSRARQLSFVAGALVIYGVLDTRFEYLAEHQFFFNRLQHVGMHHLGPLLIALAWPGATIKAGMPKALQRLTEHPAITTFIRVIQQPILAPLLFVGLIFFWLIPSIHFRAMINPTLYDVMNWSMVADGILFWCLVLDPRPAPPARASFGARAALAVAVMFPQIIGGAMIAFNPHDLYTFYDLCGRIYPHMDPHYDQTIGGLIVWIPPAMMSVLGLILVLNALRREEERSTRHDIDNGHPSRPRIDARQWTG